MATSSSQRSKFHLKICSLSLLRRFKSWAPRKNKHFRVYWKKFKLPQNVSACQLSIARSLCSLKRKYSPSSLRWKLAIKLSGWAPSSIVAPIRSTSATLSATSSVNWSFSFAVSQPSPLIERSVTACSNTSTMVFNLICFWVSLLL